MGKDTGMPGVVEPITEHLLLRRYVAEDANPLHENYGQNEAMYEYSG